MPEEDKVVVRMSLSFPKDIFEKLGEIERKQHRSLASVVVEACDFFVNEKPILEAEAIARRSPEYQAILARARRDLGLPPESLDENRK